MRPALLLQGLIALVLGAVVGFGFLFGTGQFRSPSDVEALRVELEATRSRVDERKAAVFAAQEAAAAAAAAEAAEAERLIAEERAREEAAAEEAAERKRRAEELAARQPTQPKPSPKPVAHQPAAYGILTIRAQSPVTAISGGKSVFGKGLDLPFSEAPGKITLKSGAFTVQLMTKVVASRLMLDVTVSPMSIISAEGTRLGTSAHGLQVGKNAFPLAFDSPTAGDLNLVLQYKK